MPDTTAPPSAATTVSIARKPIFEADRRLWGYELFCVGEGLWGNTDSAAMDIAASAYMTIGQVLKQGYKIVLNFDEMGIIDSMPYALPAQLAVVQVDEQLFARPAMPEMLARFKSDGYLIALRGFSGDRRFDPLYQMADIIGVAVTGHQKTDVSQLLGSIHGVNARLLARRVDDAMQFDMCRDAGVTLFEGAFFKRPDTITIHKITSNKTARLKLLQRIETPDPDIDEMAEAIQTDAAISFRLLTYLNSAAFGLSQKVKSIHHAIRLLGWPKLKKWLRVVLINDMSESDCAVDLLQLSAQRGKFLEQVAADHDFWGFDPESLHLLGLFSLLDAILATSMAEIVSYLPIENKLKSALRQDPNNEYHPLLQLAQYLEEARWEDADVMIQQLNLNHAKVIAAFNAAVAWADQLTGMDGSENS
jgi:EAL and modified HD-GYP domain-containing signal transduction protein